MIIPHYYEDPHTLHVGTMPNRAYYIPSSRRSDALVEHRETSDRFQLLNGSWRFRYYASIYDLQDAFYEVGYGTARTRRRSSPSTLCRTYGINPKHKPAQRLISRCRSFCCCRANGFIPKNR